MSDQDTLTNFKQTTIELVEEFIIEKITRIAPDSLRKELILDDGVLKGEPNFLEQFFEIPDGFWDMGYKWFQHHKSINWTAQELHNFLLHEMKPSLDLFQDVISDKLLVLTARKLKIEKCKSGRKTSKNRVKFEDTIPYFDPNEYMQSLIESMHDVCAVRIAGELITTMELDKLSLATLENLLDSTSKSVPITEETLKEITGLPTPAPLRASVESHYRPDKWKKGANNFGVFESISKTNPKNRVEVYVGGEKDGDILAWEAALQVIDLMGIDAAKLQLVFASYAFNSSIRNKPTFTLKGTEIIKQIGWDKKHRINASEKLAKIASIAFHLGRMLMECTWVEGKPKGNKVDVSVSISPLWVIEVDARGQKNIFTEKVDAPEEIYINVSPGPWAEKWLNRMGMKAGMALHQFGWLATELLKIDPYHDELALKLAIHLTMASRIKMQDKNQYEHKAGSLLEAIELEARINAAHQEKRQAYNLKQRWDSALTLLMSMNWRVIFDDTTYPEWLRPNSKAKKPSNSRKEKIIDRLWKAKITIMPPEPIPMLLTRKAAPSKLKSAKRTKSETILTGADIRKKREAKGVSQKALAEWTGKTKAWLCMVEKGKRKIDQKQAKHLYAGIDILTD
ncbi:MAG: helix-turn-helix transcriptional regulator [Cyanobacteria bacterium J06628_3]